MTTKLAGKALAAAPGSSPRATSAERAITRPERRARAAAFEAGPGEPLSAELSQAMGSAFGFDFANVRVHSEHDYPGPATTLGRKAVTVGNDIFFARQQFSPGTPSGREVLAHELAHVIQAHQQPTGADAVASDDSGAEAVARQVGRSVASGGRAETLLPTQGLKPRQLGRDVTLFRFPGVVPEALAEDRIRRIDPGNPASELVYNDTRGYIRNPSATRLSDVVSNGRVTGDFRNGTFQYVVDQNGEVWVGRRMRQNMPHPTLIGGRDPQVQAAGMLEIQGGEIVRVDNHSGHFRPPRPTVRRAIDALTRLPREAIQRLRGESVHFDNVAGQEQVRRRPVRSLRLVLNRIRQIRVTRPIQRFRSRYQHDARFRSRVRGGAASAAAIIATLIVGYFLDRWRRQLENEQIERDIDRLLPEVRRQLIESLTRNTDELDRLIDDNPAATIYLNMTFRIGYMHDIDPDGPPIETYWATELVSANYSLTAAQETSSLSFEQVGCVSRMDWTSFTISEPVPLSEIYAEEGAGAPPAPPAQESAR